MFINLKQSLMLVAVATMLGSTTASADYMLRNRNSGLCATVTGQDTPIRQYACNSARTDQRFDITGYVAASNSHRIKSKLPGDLCLSIEQASYYRGYKAITWPCQYDVSNSTTSNQLHQLVPLADGFYKIAPTHQIFIGQDYAIDVDFAGTTEALSLIQWPWHGGPSQQWALVYVP
ncbi:RICIN domain-containing protein [Archangium gephyra]|uniref:RICIN domain-containing protein n=1 Tax=Archangium gephyra TaxID=48 RepID=UPI0035D50A97